MPSAAAGYSFGAVEPVEYLQLADEWALADNWATLRSAVDRAYYAAFLTVRDELTRKGYGSFDASSRTHGQVSRSLAEVRRELGERLANLRRARNALTYETGTTELPENQTPQDILNSARQIIAAVEALPELSDG